MPPEEAVRIIWAAVEAVPVSLDKTLKLTLKQVMAAMALPLTLQGRQERLLEAVVAVLTTTR